MAFGAALDWPAASAAHANLVRLYGRGSARIVQLKVNSMDWACGAYTVRPSQDRWEFVQSRSVLWAQEKSPDWLRDGDRSEGGRKWANCMNHLGRSRRLRRQSDAWEAWLVCAALGVLG